MRSLLVGSVLVASVAALDAVRGEHWDQLAMLLVLGLLAVAALVVSGRPGESVSPRSDLMAWVREQAAFTDDEPQLVVDRALSAYRARLLPEDEGLVG